HRTATQRPHPHLPSFPTRRSSDLVQPALDLAASEFFRNGKYRYRERTISPEEQVDFVERLARDYGLFSVEDPFDQEDFGAFADRSEEHTSELQSRFDLVCRLLLEK